MEDQSYQRGRGNQYPLPVPQTPSQGAQHGSKIHPKDQGQGQSRYSTLPDLRFLNFNKPAPTGTSILDPKSTNSANVQQFQALREAESWFAGTALLLKERLALCEQLRDGLGETVKLLGMVEALKMGLEEGSDYRSQGLTGERTRPVDIAEQVPTGKEGLTEEVAQREIDEVEVAALVGRDVDFQPESTTGSSSAPAMQTSTSGHDLEAVEEAVQIWLKDIRVLRAKWIAGGRDTEKRMGLR